MLKFNVNVNCKAYSVEVEETTDGNIVMSAPVQVASAPKAVTPAPAGNGTPVKAPMTGLVKKLCFANGASVKKGDAVIILEAMKMDTPVSATADGVITYSTTEGTNVDTGAVLATIA